MSGARVTTIDIVGASAVGKTSLLRRFADDEFSAISFSGKGRLVSINVDGIPTEVRIADGDKSGARVHMILFDVRAPRSLTTIAHRLQVAAEKNHVAVLVGTKVDDRGGMVPAWRKTVDAARELGDYPMFLTSSYSNMGVTAAFRSTMRLVMMRRVKRALELRAVRAMMVPRQKGLLNLAGNAAMYGGMVSSEYTHAQPPVLVVLTSEDLDEYASEMKDDLMSPTLGEETLIWLPGNKATYRKAAVKTVLSTQDDAGRLLLEGRKGSSVEAWLSSSKLPVGIIEPNPTSTRDVEEIGSRLARVKALDDHAPPMLVPWSQRREVAEMLMHQANGSALLLRQLCDNFVTPWSAYHATLVKWRRMLHMAGISEVPIKEMADTYELGTPAKLGEGSFGCVLRTADGRALKLTFFPKFDGRGALERDRMEKNFARLEIAFPQYLSDACRFACPYLPDGVTGYIATSFPGASAITDDIVPQTVLPYALLSPGAQRTFAQEIVYHCLSKFQQDPYILDRGAAVTLLPIYDRGDFVASESPIYSVDVIPGLAFQLFYQLLAYNAITGFVHLDIKGENVLVRSRRDDEPAEYGLRIRMPNDDGQTVQEMIVLEKSPYVAVFADFGLSAMNAVPRFSVATTRAGDSSVQVHTTGTIGFLDPTAGMFFDPRDSDETDLANRPRGLAGDIWATALTLLTAWNRTTFVNSDNSDRFDRTYITAILVNEVADVHKLVSRMRTKGVTTSKPNEVQLRDDIWGQKGDLFDYYGRVFVNSLLLHKAFRGKWPAKDLGTGPHWNYIFRGSFLRDLERAAATWSTTAGEEGTVYDYMARQLDDDTKDFFAKCFTFDTDERTAFVQSGDVFRHPFIQRGIITPDATDDVSCTHALDLYDL